MQEWKRKEPPPIQAIQLTEDNLQEVIEWCGGEGIVENTRIGVFLDTPVGPRRVWLTDYLVCENGMFRKESAATFESQFEPNQQTP